MPVSITFRIRWSSFQKERSSVRNAINKRMESNTETEKYIALFVQGFPRKRTCNSITRNWYVLHAWMSSKKSFERRMRMLLDCGHEESPHKSRFTTGYGIDKDGNKICYRCCAMRDLEQMRKEGRITLYLVDKDGLGTVTNWPGSLVFYSSTPKLSWHNRARVRYDYWFILDGYYWHGYTVGNNTQIAHCKRTKDLFTAQTSCLIIPVHLIKG